MSHRKSQKSMGSQQATQANSIMSYIIDTIDAITDQICTRIPSIPMQIRLFCKALYDSNYEMN